MNTAFHVEPFTFDRIFALTPADAAMSQSDLRLQVLAIQAEFELLKDDTGRQIALARSQGFEDGMAQVRGERDTAMLHAVDTLHAGLCDLDGSFEATETRLRRAVVDVAMAAAETIAGRALIEVPLASIDAAIGRVLHQVGCRQALQVRVHPALAAEVEALIVDRQSRERRRMTIAVGGDDTLAMGDARIFWDQGGLTLNAASRRRAVRTELGLIGDIPEHAGTGLGELASDPAQISH